MRQWLRSLVNRFRRRVWRALFYRVLFGERTQLGGSLPMTRISPATCIEYEDRLVVANHVFIGHFNFIEASHGVRIDEGVQISNYVSLITHSSHRSQRLLGREYNNVAADLRPGFISGPVHIGAFSFIAPHCIIEANTTLGKGCLVLSHSRVRGVYPDFAVIGGVPAKVLGDTRDTDIALLEAHPAWLQHYETWAGRDALAGRRKDL